MYNPNTCYGAQRLINICGALKSKETIAIVTDSTKLDLAGLIAGQVAIMEAEPVILVMTPRDVDGEDPPELISKAMFYSDLIVLMATRSLSHTQAVLHALENGARVVSISNVTEELLATGGIYADFHAIRPSCEALAEIFTKGSELQVTAPGGTELKLSISDRNGNSHHCIADKPGMFTAVPNIEANIAPVEESAEGCIVFDASIPNFNIGVLDSPVKLEVKNGMVVNISGGRQAKMLEHFLANQQDINVYNIAQVAVGLNPKCRYINGQMTNDHGVLGTMHFGVGTSRNLGGDVKASLHFDGILWAPTIMVDNQEVLSRGKPIGNWAKGLNLL